MYKITLSHDAAGKDEKGVILQDTYAGNAFTARSKCKYILQSRTVTIIENQVENNLKSNQVKCRHKLRYQRRSPI